MEISQYGKVAVLMGGTSNERDISLESGRAVLTALHKKNIVAEAFDPKNDDLNQLQYFDRAFICLHGKDGEDGEIQKILERKNLPYTGSDIISSSVGMDKFRSKSIWKSKNINTPDFIQVNDINDFNKASNLCGLPFFIKPASFIIFKGLSSFIIVVADIVLASSISLFAGAKAISRLEWFNLIIFIRLLKYGHFLCDSCGEQNGKIKIKFLPKYLLTILSTLTDAQEKSGVNVYWVFILDCSSWNLNLSKTESWSKIFLLWLFFKLVSVLLQFGILNKNFL